MRRTERCGVNGRCPRGFELIRSKVDVDVDFVSCRLEDWSEAFDVVLINNVINHLDEGACQRLHLDAQARRTYRAQLEKAAEVTKSWLIVADCSRSNLFASLRVQNPFAPSIEWDQHQRPELWAEILEMVGFRRHRLRWNAPARLGMVGQAILGNRLGGYLTNSHFIMTLRRATETSDQP